MNKATYILLSIIIALLLIIVSILYTTRSRVIQVEFQQLEYDEEAENQIMINAVEKALESSISTKETILKLIALDENNAEYKENLKTTTAEIEKLEKRLLELKSQNK